MRCPRCYGQRKVLLIGFMEDDCPKCDGTGVVHGEEKTNDDLYSKSATSFVDYDVQDDETSDATIGSTQEWEQQISETPRKRGRPRKEL